MNTPATRHAPVRTCGAILFIALAVFVQCGAGQDRLFRAPKEKPADFREVWGYLMRGEEHELKGNEPLTDICYFSARVDRNGKLAGPRDLPGAVKNRSARWHLVVAEISNSLLIGTCIDPSRPAREALIKDINDFSGSFAGVQIDFEAVNPWDRDNYISFLADLKALLGPEKILSVALPARVRKVADAYDYAAVAAVADRVVVMAYDQHWSTGEPGPVASLPWCRDVAAYAKSAIPVGKLVMGVPLYGRAWQEVQHGGALRDSRVKEILSRKRPRVEVDPEKGPSMVYTEKVRVRAYFNTLETLTERTRLYSKEGALGVAFWRIGQGDARLWDHIRVAAEGKE